MSPATRPRRGETLVDHLLVLTVATVAVIVAAYVWMPDFQRGLQLVVERGSELFGF